MGGFCGVEVWNVRLWIFGDAEALEKKRERRINAGERIYRANGRGRDCARGRR